MPASSLRADATDVAARVGRVLTEEEAALAETLAGDVLRRIRRRIPDLDLRVEGEGRPLPIVTPVIDLEDLKAVQATVVARVIRNPDGYRSENAEGVGYSFDTRAAAGFIYLDREDWELLGVSAGGKGIRSLAPKTDDYLRERYQYVDPAYAFQTVFPAPDLHSEPWGHGHRLEDFS